MKRLLLAALCVAGCSPELSLGPNDVVACGASGVCPNDLVCVNGTRCVDERFVDTAGANILVPPDNSVVRAGSVEFVWAPVLGAAEYRLEIARDAAMTDVVATETTANLRASLPLAEGSYHWRVTSDITRVDATTETALLGVLADSVYVYCSSGCEPGTTDLGTATHPFRSIARALTYAALNSLSTVRVATRSDGQPYDESLVVTPGLELLGGYSADFGTRSGRTPVEYAGSVLDIANVGSRVTVVDGFELTNAAVDGPSSVVNLYRATSALSLTNLGIISPLWRTNVVKVAQSADAVGPRIRNVAISAQMQADGCVDVPCKVVEIGEDSAVELTDFTLDATATDSGESFAVWADRAYVVLRDGHIVLHGAYEDTYGLQFGTEVIEGTDSAYTVEDSFIEVSSTRSATGVRFVNARTLTLARSTILVRSEATAYGVSVESGVTFGSDGVTVIASNVIEVDGDLATYGLVMNNKGGVLAGNTIATGNAEIDEIAVQLLSAHPRMLNNLLISYAHTCTAPAPGCNFGVAEERRVVSPAPPTPEPSGQPFSFASNYFVGYGGASSCAFGRGTDPISCLADLNDTRASGGRLRPAVVGGNVAATLFDVKLETIAGADGVFATADDVLTPADGSVLIGKGYDTSRNSCSATPAGSPSTDGALHNYIAYLIASNAPLCGGPFADIDGTSRPPSPTVGAYEIAD